MKTYRRKNITRLACILLAALFCAVFACAPKRPADPKQDAGIVPLVPADTEHVTDEPAESSVTPSPSADGTEAPETTDELTAGPTEAITLSPTPAPTDTPEPTPAPTPEPTPSPAPTNEPTAAPTPAPTPTPTAVPTPKPTAAPTATPKPTSAPISTPAPSGNPDQSVFDNCAFVGYSTFEGLHHFGIITHGHWFTRVGLNINTVYTTPTEHGSVPIIDELNTGSYEAVILMFGQNECGWPSLDSFITKYERLLHDIWTRQPNAVLFVTGIPPVSKAHSDEGHYGVTNPHINYINNGLSALCVRTPNAYFITVPPELIGSDGALPPNASSDGVHLNGTYLRIWANHITRFVTDILR